MTTCKSVRRVGMGKENERLLQTGNLDSCFLLPQQLVAIHEERLVAGGFILLLTFLGGGFHADLVCGQLLNADLLLLSYTVSKIQAQGKFISIMTQWVPNRYSSLGRKMISRWEIQLPLSFSLELSSLCKRWKAAGSDTQVNLPAHSDQEQKHGQESL